MPVAITGTIVLHDATGKPYPALGQPGVSADIEALRIDPQDGSIWYASEGDRKARLPSFLHRVDGRGNFAFPASLQIQPDCECGGRSNAGPEGMSFSHDGRHLWLAMEAPLIEDGPVAAPGQGATTRVVLTRRDGAVVAQYRYALDPAPAPAFAGGYVDRGVSEVLATGPTTLLVLERAGRQIDGKLFDFAVRLYEVDLAGAAPRRLLFDSTTLSPGWSDNYEAMAWGPLLPGGRRSLVIASDNNFSGGPTRFLVFDAGPAHH